MSKYTDAEISRLKALLESDDGSFSIGKRTWLSMRIKVLEADERDSKAYKVLPRAHVTEEPPPFEELNSYPELQEKLALAGY